MEGKDVVDFLLAKQNRDGSFLWQEGISSSPVQMTAYGIMALAGKYFPLVGGVGNEKGTFSDLPPTHWAYLPLEKLAAAGIFNGYPDGTIRPEKQVTRAEFATLLVRALDLEVRGDDASLSFTDVPPDHWAREAIATAAAAGFIRGRSDTVFDPESSITGGEVMAMLGKAMPQKEQVPGAAGPYWYSQPVAVAEENALLYPGFDPVQRASWGNAPTVWRLLALVGKSSLRFQTVKGDGLCCIAFFLLALGVLLALGLVSTWPFCRQLGLVRHRDFGLGPGRLLAPL